MSDRQLVIVKNPFERADRDVIQIPAELRTVAALVGEYIPAGVEVDVSINGHVLKREAWATHDLVAGDQMLVVPHIAGDNFNPLSAILMIAVMAYAGPAAFAMFGGEMTATAFAASTFGMVATAGVTMVGAMVVGALLGPVAPDLPSGSYDTSPAYSWNPATIQQAGGPVARAYGRTKLYGNIIAGYISATGDTGEQQTGHMLVDLGTGPYQQLWDQQINDQPIGSYNSVTQEHRLGNINQSVIADFNDTYTTGPVGTKLVAGGAAVTHTSSSGGLFAAMDVVLTCPNGLWHMTDKGDLESVSVQVKIELSKDGGLTWETAVQSASTMNVTTVGYWSAGYNISMGSGEDTMYASNVWREEAVGTSVRSAHTEGDTYGAVAGTSYVATWRWMDTAVTRAVTTAAFVQLSANSTQPIRKTIRVRNITPGTTCLLRLTNLNAVDQTSSRYSDDVYLAEVNEILTDDFTYPRTVLVAVKALATDQLSGSMKFSCMADCAIIRVWNGLAWVSQWSRNPAWVAWDILTQPVLDNSLNVVRYDARDPSTLDLPSFYAWSQWCERLVSDGNGGTEAANYWDGVFDTVTDSWSAALEVAASARATLVLHGTTVHAVWDRERPTPTQLFTVANSSGFTETFLPMDDRASSIEVEYVNALAGYQRDTVSIHNTAVAALSSNTSPARMALRGVNRVSQAWREATYLLARNEFLLRTAELSVDIDALASTVGDRVDVQNDVPEWGEGGRAVSGTTTSIVLDHPVTLASGTNEIVVRLADDTVATRTITTAAGTVTSVVWTTPLPSAITGVDDVWAIGAVGMATKPFLITGIRKDGDQRVRLSLIEYNASIYGTDAGTPAYATPNVSASKGMGTILLVDPAAQAAALAGAGAGNVTNGSHKYVVFFNGTLQAGEVSSLVVVADNTVDGKVSLTGIPIGGAGTTSRVVYRTAAAGTTYLQLAVISDNTTTTYLDNVADASLGSASPTVRAVLSNPSDRLVLGADGTISTMIDFHWWFSDRVKTAKTHISWAKTGSPWTVYTTDGDSSVIGPVTDGASYYIYLAAENNLGQIQPWSNAQSFTYTPQGKLLPPADVVSLTATSTDNGYVLTWPAVTDLDLAGYELRSGGSAWGTGDTVLVKNLKATSFNVGIVHAGTSVTYRIKAIDTTTHYSTNAVAAAVTVPAITAPTITSVTSGTNELILAKDGTVQSRVLVAWTASTDPYVLVGGKVVVYYAPSGASEMQAVNLPGGAAQTYLAPVKDGQLYAVAVVFANKFGDYSTTTSTTHTVVGKTASPPDVTNFVVTELADGKRSFTWDAITDADLKGYEIRYSTSDATWLVMASNKLTGLTGVPTNFFTDRTLAAGTYYFKIKAVDTSVNTSTNATNASVYPKTFDLSPIVQPVLSTIPASVNVVIPAGQVQTVPGTLTVEGRVTVEGRLDVTNRNTSIGIDENGHITGLSAGSGTPVSNAKISLTPAGILTGAGGGVIDLGSLTGSVTTGQLAAHIVAAVQGAFVDLSAIHADLGAVMAGSIVVGSANKLWLNEGADGVLAIGGTDKATAPFHVSAAGVLTAASVTTAGTTAAWGGISSMPANISTAGGSPAISLLNNAISLSSAGVLSGAGGGTIDLGSLSGSVTTGQLTANIVAAVQGAFANLAAIKADLGSVTAGQIVVGTTDKLWLNDAADGALAIGGAVKATAPFRVNAAGVLTATSGTTGGWTLGAATLTAAGLTIDSAGKLRYGKTSLADTAAGWYLGTDGIAVGAASDATVLRYNAGTSAFDFIGTISGRSTLTLASTVDASGNVLTDIINARMDTSAKSILAGFDFASANYAGALKAGTITWNATTGAITGGSGVVIHKGGILGAAAGVATFTLDSATGASTFAGNLSAPSGTLGTITAGTITGATIQTASSGERVVLDNSHVHLYNASGTQIGAAGRGGYIQGSAAFSASSSDALKFGFWAKMNGLSSYGLHLAQGLETSPGVLDASGTGGHIRLFPTTVGPGHGNAGELSVLGTDFLYYDTAWQTVRTQIAASLPAFLAYNSATDANQTGNGTIANPQFDTEVLDQGGNFASNTFTASVTGRHRFSTSVVLSNLSATPTINLYLTTSNRTYGLAEVPVTWSSSFSGRYSVGGSVLVDMDAGDTAYVRTSVSGMGADTAGIYGTSQPYTFFSGELVC